MDSPTTTLRTAVSTPSSSPGLYSPTQHLPQVRNFSALSDSSPAGSPYLHPLQMHKVKETHKAAIEQDFITGRKLINQYEILNEIGRGVHGKVKLARSLENSEFVAIKIIQRFSKTRRLGKVMVSPEIKTKREIAILKKIRHPNVVGLLEVIDDPELKKIYMVLEHVELGEVAWRKKGTKEICAFERNRIERELRGDFNTTEEENFFNMMAKRRARRDAQRNRLRQLSTAAAAEYWSLEHGDEDEDETQDQDHFDTMAHSDMQPLSRISTRESIFQPRSHTSHTSMARSNPSSRAQSRGHSRGPSRSNSSARVNNDFEIGPMDIDNDDDLETPGPLPSLPSTHSSNAGGLHAHMLAMYSDEMMSRGRSPSMADSIISHMSSIDDTTHNDVFSDDFSYVPCFTVEQARSAFRDTVLGLEYLHYEGVVHRDIKPANLLWTGDHRVKISDFGVSYFGKPTRDGELEDVSESDARDFDDELELAKTVGTPAFFAPELCFTSESDEPPPRVTEQIDVWSLGVTLYCLIFARVPFLADDEWQLFKTIATEDVYIPRRRLRPVNPVVPTSGGRPTPTPPDGWYRDDSQLAMEKVDDELHDLLRRMLVKNPVERMKLREVKRHPWVISGIDNVIGWLDDTDPSRRTAGRRIQVNDRELERAVVPITFLERARSAVKKAVGKVIGRTEGSRRRAISSAASSAGDASVLNSPSAPAKDSRRASLREDDESYFSHPTEHPLSQSVAASPEQPSSSVDLFSKDFSTSSPTSSEVRETISTASLADPIEATSVNVTRPPPPDRAISTAASIQTVVNAGHSRDRSLVPSPPIEEAKADEESAGAEDRCPTFTDHLGGVIRVSRALHNTRSMDVMKETSDDALPRAQSADRVLFMSSNKHSEASLAISTAVAGGSLEQPTPTQEKHHDLRSLETSPTSPNYHQSFRPSHLVANRVMSSSSPNVTRSLLAASDLEQRPATANHIPEGQTPAPRVYTASTPESFQQAQEQLIRRQLWEARNDEENQEALVQRRYGSSDCPPSPDDDDFFLRQQGNARVMSAMSIHSGAYLSPLHSPTTLHSAFQSPVSLSSQEQFFASNPSLPTLASGATSVSDDIEGDMLSKSGTVQGSETPETLTPPLLSKQQSRDAEASPSAVVGIGAEGADGADDDEEGYNGDQDHPFAASSEDNDDSDSDGGLMMGRSKRKPNVTPSPASKRPLERRDTNVSIASTETAKQVHMSE